MPWNWQQPDWPHFSWDKALLQKAEEEFLRGGGVISGALKHLPEIDQEQLAVEAMSTEALTTSEIEGEILDRASVQSSLRKQLGLATDRRNVRPAEQGIAEMIISLCRSFHAPLSEETLFTWHAQVTKGRHDLRNIGRYRKGDEPMQVVSGAIYSPTVHFEAPPSTRVTREMTAFIKWFNRTAPAGPDPLPALTRAGIAHLYFESIHPFEDGNGRIGRAISEKALAQGSGHATLTALARNHPDPAQELLRDARSRQASERDFRLASMVCRRQHRRPAAHGRAHRFPDRQNQIPRPPSRTNERPPGKGVAPHAAGRTGRVQGRIERR